MPTYKPSVPMRRNKVIISASAGPKKLSRATPLTKSAEANKASTAVPKGWRAEIVADAKTNRVTLILMFPTWGGKERILRVPAERRENLAWVRKELLGYDAALPGPQNNDYNLIKALIDGVERTPLIETSKPGFTASGEGFVLGDKLLGDAVDRYWWRDDPDEMNLGATRGTKSGWDEAGRLLRHSSFMSLAVLAMLASPVPKYVELRASRDGPRAPLLSETATFNFVGASASGKTLALELAASLSGHPDKRSKWDFSRRGLEEYLESRNQVGAIFDDIEKHIGEKLNINKAISIVTQYVPEGSSKELSGVAEKMGLTRLTWQEFAVSSSHRPIDEFVPTGRSDGEKVRFVDQILPRRERGGIIDNPPIGANPVEFAIDTAKKIEIGIAGNYGHVMPAWIEVLLAEDWSDRLEELRDYFVEKMAPDGSGYERRFAAKYGVLYAVGKVAVENGVLDWPADWPAKAVARCYRNALAAANREKTQMTRALARLQKAVSDGRFVVPLAVGRRIIVVSENDYGVICRYKGAEVVAVTDAALQSICGDRLVMKALVSFLKTKQVYKGGHGHAGTTQVPIKVRIGGKVVDKPRFWIFDREALMQLRRAPSKPASAPRSRGSVPPAKANRK